MKILFYFFLIFGLALPWVGFSWVAAILWKNIVLEDNYTDKIIMIDAISVQLTIFEILLAVIGVALAIASFFGYQRMKEFIVSEVTKSVNNVIDGKINDALDKRADKSALSPDISTPTMEKESDIQTEDNV